MRVLLFDVDGTLVDARGAGRRALAVALGRVYGTTGPVDGYDMRGKTDPQIVHDLMAAAGVAPAVIGARTAACLTIYLEELARGLRAGPGVRLLPGVDALVRTLAGRADVLVGLLTGNLEEGARLKLETTGLWPLFRVGAFSSDDPDRRRLVGIARGRAEGLLGRAVEPGALTVIGDTPLDVACARAGGARAVAVATGHYPSGELAACAPDALLPDFADLALALRALTAP